MIPAQSPRLMQKFCRAVRWRKLLARTALWLAAEIWLNCIGWDYLADYSEFLFERPSVDAIVNLAIYC